MSRAEIDLLLIEIDRTTETIAEYRTDAAGLVARWEAAEADRSAGRWEGGTLTEEERSAFAGFDYATLYRLGAHPFLLWQMVRSVAGDTPIADLVAEYRQAIEPFGHPPFGT